MKNNNKESISVNDVSFVVESIRTHKKPNSKVRGLIKKGRMLLKEGDEGAANLFGILYSDGILFKRNLSKSAELLLVGEKTNNHKMIYNAARTFMKMSINKKPGTKEKNDLFNKAIEYATRAANDGYFPAIMYIIDIHANRDSYDPNLDFNKLMSDCYNFNDPEKMKNAIMERESRREDKSNGLIIKKWYEKAIALGEKEAMVHLAKMYFYDEIEDTPNNSNFKKLLFGAIEEKLPGAYLLLGRLYSSDRNRIVDHDEALAFKWTLMAAEAGDEEAMMYVSSMYEYGIGVEKSAEKHRYWIDKLGELWDLFDLQKSTNSI